MRIQLVLFVWLLLSHVVFGDEHAPNAKLSLEFPELPNTLNGMVKGRMEVAKLSAILPSNFSADSKHPLFVYLKGGSGGPEDFGARAREMIGQKDFIAVSMPLFKRSQPQGQTLPVVADDFEIISDAYSVMLEKLMTVVPNVDWDRSVIGGHSNGAHTLGVLLSGKENFIRDRFPSYYLHEGGLSLFMVEGLSQQQFAGKRFLVLLAEQSMGRKAPLPNGRPSMPDLISSSITKLSLDCEVVTMFGYGHDVPPEYHRVIGQWSRRERLDNIVQQERAWADALKLPLLDHPQSSAWNDLLIGDLTNMKWSGAAWKYSNGILTTPGAQNIWTKAKQGDCVLDFEFQLETGASSGVLLYNSDESNWQSNSVEIQICDDSTSEWQEKPKTWQCGAFFGHQAPTKSAVRAADQWNRMTITTQGSKITVVLNSEVVNQIDLVRWTNGKSNPDGSEIPESLQGKPWSEMPYQGRLGFQGGHTDARVQFRNVKLLRLRK